MQLNKSFSDSEDRTTGHNGYFSMCVFEADTCITDALSTAVQTIGNNRDHPQFGIRGSLGGIFVSM